MKLPFRDKKLPIEQRIDDLLSRLTYDEKLDFLNFKTQGIARLGIPAYSWWSEALHGLARSGAATVFPQAIALAATFTPQIVERMGKIIAEEGRARHFDALKHGQTGIYYGLCYCAPNVNIFRDPRWGRGHETYGECPFLTGQLGAAYVRGIQGSKNGHLRAVAVPKHYAAHSGPEAGRTSFNCVVSEKDLHETYLPAFKACVKAGAMSIMPAYTACNGTPCTINSHLLVDILRKQWGFQGVAMSDCGAGVRLVTGHKAFDNYTDALKCAFENGLDIAMDNLNEEYYKQLHALKLDPRFLDDKLRLQFRILFRLGLMDDEPDDVPSPDVIESPQFRREALNASRRSIVLLKNQNGLLPLDKKKLNSIAVIGPNADNVHALMGNYYGRATRVVTLLQGVLNEADGDVHVIYARGSDLVPMRTENVPTIAEAVSAAERADVTLLFVGLSPELEDEETTGCYSKNGADKIDLELPENQQELVKAVGAVAKKLVIINMSGSAVRIPDEKAGAVLQVFYPGAEGGTAVADVLFGKVNPSGHLPVTFYKDIKDLPDFSNYDMAGRTYRYFSGKVQYPFGYGLSYTEFKCTKLCGPAAWKANRRNTLKVTWKNYGKRAGEDVIQVYVRALDASVGTPLRQLVAVKRVSLKAGEEKEFAIVLSNETFALYDANGKQFYENGSWELLVGDKKLKISCKVNG
ncbi:MAG: glycoside hydrolase family 3 C-terminal domain-containing protein [Victivallales bacterium]|nr:glycoside hydrolase family 3 C-terminal domain-containing protein [Victivallales bacterium]